MVGVESAELGNSLSAAATMLIDYGIPAIPVVADGIYRGILFESDLLQALSENLPANASVEEAMKGIPPILNRATSSEALRQMEAAGVAALAVVDERGFVQGVITASRLLAINDRYARPKLVGGLATPFGVRLLGGGAIGGVNSWHLLGTGAVMFLTFIAGSYLALIVGWFVPVNIRITDWYYGFHSVLGLVFFLLLLRAQPLSGYHAAEHMVVHAIEQSEPLEPDVVARMSRVHPRCGTNVAVGAGMFIGISQAQFIPDPDLRLVLAIFATLFLFRPVGSFVQRSFTTRPPNRKQIDAGIKAGKELLANYQTGTTSNASIPTRIWQTGMLHVIAGSMASAFILYQLLAVLPIPDYWKVIY